MCERNIIHQCKYNPKNQILIISHDYLNHKNGNLSSCLNDITLVWNYVRYKLCFNKSQIFIYGCMNTDGKMIPWLECYVKDKIPDKNILLECNYFYYSGHGYSNGKIDNYNLISNKNVFNIIDSCYSYLIYDSSKMKGIMASTDGKKTFLSTSSRMCSYFTSELFDYLSSDSKEDIKEWFRKKDFMLEGDYYGFEQ